MIYEGLVDEGLAFVKGVRDRHTGTRRNAWDECECGHHYVRSMASYALLIALSGFSYSAPRKEIGLAPRVYPDNFTCFFCVEGAWGMLHHRTQSNRPSIELRHGELTLQRLHLSFTPTTAKLNDRPLPATPDGTSIQLAEPAKLRAGDMLNIA